MDYQALQKQYLDLAARVVEMAAEKGAIAEAYISAGENLSIEVRNQEVEALTTARDQGLGLRVIADQRVGFAFTTDFSPTALELCVEQALANARMATPDEHNCLPARYPGYPQLDLFDPEITTTPVEKKIELVREIERQARAYDPRVKITESCSYNDSRYLVVLVNSQGITAAYLAAYCGASTFVVAVENEESQTGFGLAYSLRYKNIDPAKIGREGAARAVRMLGAKRVDTQRAAVVFDPYVATNFLGVIAPALAADAVQKGKSLFRGRVGQQVAAPVVNIIDDGRRPDGIASSPFDGEGVPTQHTVLVEKGVLKCYLHNTYTAARDGVKSTGNGARGSFKTTPEVGTTNFYIEAGSRTPEDIIKEIPRGLYVTEVMGMHTANPISGDFSVGASGLWIENGELTRPVRGVAIAGNIIGLLEGIDAVGNDLTFFGATGAPTVRIASMTISG
ncbi:TldD/PmbA family protein [Moorella sp. E306M]|uniref:TldD/PmbA family protein n=1 Tax=Moorella sp. E306M TaxID=2572683 RepID=UPI0010FFBF1F|nr:TldD/PmbA family protein [Moorella sp. E306M]GEA19175.1 peptidase C69 [Moorella sp. E306M]